MIRTTNYLNVTSACPDFFGKCFMIRKPKLYDYKMYRELLSTEHWAMIEQI